MVIIIVTRVSFQYRQQASPISYGENQCYACHEHYISQKSGLKTSNEMPQN